MIYEARADGMALALVGSMDAWVETAWRAFWVGLGASVVLIGQTLGSPSHAPSIAPSTLSATGADLVAPAETAPEPPPVVVPHRRRDRS